MSNDTKAHVEVENYERPTRYWTDLGYKKFETVRIDGGTAAEHVKIMFHRHEAKFCATCLKVTFLSTDYRALVAAIGKHIEASATRTFNRYIDVFYERRPESDRSPSIGGRSWSHYSSRNEDGDLESKDVSGIVLEFDVYDISEPFEYALVKGNDKAREWRRLFWDPLLNDWNVDVSQTLTCTRHEIADYLPYTWERYQTLLAIRKGLSRLDEKLTSLFREKGEKSARLLDAIDTTKLLGAGE
jgi:hypothetical protein